MNPLLALSTLLPATAGLTITTYTVDQDRLEVMVASTPSSAICPDCGTSSIHIHGHYVRHPTDLPWGGLRVRWVLWVRRCRCLVSSCPRYTFGERFLEVVSLYQRQTLRLPTVLPALGSAAGGEAGARLALRLSIEVSPDTLLRRLNCLPLAPVTPPCLVGVDDWAFRRGHRYGTILVDLEHH